MPWMDAAAAGAPPAAAPSVTAEWLRVFRCSACRVALHHPPAGSARFRCGACGAVLRAATSPLKPLQGGAKLAMAAAGPPLLLASRDLSPQSVVQGPYGGAFGAAGGSADMPTSPTSSLASSSPSLASSTAEAAIVSPCAASEHAGRGEPQPETEARAGSMWEEASIGDGVGQGFSPLFRLRMPAAAAAPAAEVPMSVAAEDGEEQFASPRSSSSMVSQAELAGAAVAEEEGGGDGSSRAMAESEQWAVPRSREEFLALDPDVLEREWRQWSSPPPQPPPPGAGPGAAVPSVSTIAGDRSNRIFAEITAMPEIVAEPLELPVSFPAGTAGVSAAAAPASARRSLPLAMTAGRDHAGSGRGQAAAAAAAPQLLTLGDNGLVAHAVVSPVSGSKDGASSSPSAMRKLRMLWFHRSKAAGGGDLRGPDLAASAPASPEEAKGSGCTSPGTPVFRRAMEMPPDSKPLAPPGTTPPVLTAAADGGSHRRATATPQLAELATAAAMGASPRSYYQRQNSLPAAALRSHGGASAALARAAEAPPAMAAVHFETAFVLPSLPLAGEPPIVACQACGASLEMPPAALRPGRPADGLRWLRCGDCRQISTFATSSPRMARPSAAATAALPMEWPAAKGSAAVLAFEVAQPVSAALAVAARADGVDDLDLPSYTPASLPSPSPYANIMYRLGDVELCDPADYETDGNGGGDGPSSRGRGALGLGRVVQKLRSGLRPLTDGSAEDLRRQRETLARFGGVSVEFSRRVVVNGLRVTDAAVAAAETKAGPIQAGSYWYDKRAGFWGMQGGPTMGVIPAHIEGFNEQLARCASGGDTGVLVNGRELPSHDLELLVRRGLPALSPLAKSGKGRRPATGGAGSSSASSVRASYLLDIWGILHNASTGAPLVALGMLCPALEVAGVGAGMFIPAHPGGKRWIAIGEGEEMWRGP
eukprot:SM000196S05356  [mRNA]  locus=s196:50393:53925:- [translate_table: standard]